MTADDQKRISGEAAKVLVVSGLSGVTVVMVNELRAAS